MKVSISNFIHDKATLQRVLSLQIGIDDRDVEIVTDKLVELIQTQISQSLLPEITKELQKRLPELVDKIGPEITLAGLKHLIKNE